ncbi:MAG: hypothetical protein Q7S52_00940 [bacterium]|nr:hypothetical protein [bacterium]
MTMDKKKHAFNRTLFRWHKTHYRDMPWRPKTRDARVRLNPYHVLVSEIMLQQTPVERVRTKYVEFLKKFPTVRLLARASLGEVLRVWSGLGYNRRARYLHDCAKKVVREHGGKLPNNFEELKKLPGIGLSTAGALLAFAFGKDEPMIDTNIRRILIRVFFNPRSGHGEKIQGQKKIQGLAVKKLPLRPDLEFFSDLVSFHRAPSDKELYLFAKTLIPKKNGRAWNYAMLDLGATLCTARKHSDQCPLMKLHGKVGDFQYKNPQKKFTGSNRFYRGRILALLAKHEALSATMLAKHIGRSIEEAHELLHVLKQERLVAVTRGKAFLP